MPDDRFLHLTATPEKGLAVLEVLRDSVEMADWEQFVKAGARLVGSGQPHLVLDLRGLRRVLSIFIGEAVQFNVEAKKRGKRFTVLAAGHIGDVFKTLLGNDLLEIVADGRSPEEIDAPRPKKKDRWRS